MIEWLFGPDAMGDYNRWTLVFLRDPGTAEWVAAGLLAALLVWLSILNLKRLPSKGWRALLFAMRMLFLIGLLLLWLRPAVQLQKVIVKKTNVAVLSDRSLSMSLPSGVEGLSRAEEVGEFFLSNQAWIGELAKRHHLHAYGFDGAIRSMPLTNLSDPSKPNGANTSIPGALALVLDNFREGELAAALLFSDGVNNPPDAAEPSFDELLERFEKAGVPIHSFGAGSEKGVRDIGIRDVHYDGFAFVHNKMTIEVELSSTGYPEKNIQVNLDVEGRPVATGQVTIPENGAATATFTITPDKVGRYLYTAKIARPPDDAIPENNSLSFLIDVIRDKIRALHVVGHPDYDEQFLRRHLKNNPNVDLISFFILRTNSDLQLVPENELSLIPFPTEDLFQKELHTFDLVIFQNFTYRGYQMAQYLPNIRRYVYEGGAFLVIGGDLSYGSGGYDGTAIEDVLPFEIAPSDPSADQKPFSIKVTEEGFIHPVMQIRPGREANEAAWNKAPELIGLNLGLVPKPEALVLATHPTLKTRGAPAPVLAIRRVGRGRVLGLAADSTWAWHLLDVAEGGDGAFYHAFWNNAIRWLISDPDLKHLVLRADKNRMNPGETVKLDIRVTDADFQPKKGARLKISAGSSGGKRPIFSKEIGADAEGSAFLSFEAPDREGALKIEAVEEGGLVPGNRDELLLFVGRAGGELKNIKVDFKRLAELSEKTGGRFFSLPHEAGDDLIFPKPTSERIGKKRDMPIWDNTSVLILLALIIAAEWWLRKRRRLN